MSIRTRIEASITSQLRRAGYDLRRLEMGQDAYCDIKQIIGEKSSPVLFDVGANVGQIIDILLNLFISRRGGSRLRARFNRHSDNYRTHPKIPNVRLNNSALGAGIGKRALFENSLYLL